MTREEQIRYWLDSADIDYTAMQHLMDAGDYSWALFTGHLVIEKLLKAWFVKQCDEPVPAIHNLLRIAEKSSLPLDQSRKEQLLLITSFNISARYPDYKLDFYRKCDREYTGRNIALIKELRSWLLSMISG